MTQLWCHPAGSLSFFWCQLRDSKRYCENAQGLLRPGLAIGIGSLLRLLLAKASYRASPIQRMGKKTPNLDGKRYTLYFKGCADRKGWRIGVLFFFRKILLSPNQTAQYRIRSLHVFFTFFISCRFSQQETHLFF